jgi:hypothetical protein
MSYRGLVIVIAFSGLLLGINEAAAAWGNPPDSGYCRAGTCAGDGGQWARHLKNCKKENCRKQ